MPEFMRYPSRRSVVYSTHGMVACTQPLAAQAGIRVLQEGGNAADAAVAVAAVLSLTEPASTGIGGDMFCMYYNPTTRRVHSLNGSGRSPAALTTSHVLRTIPADQLASSHNRIPDTHVHSVTVPGAAAGWCDTVEKFGSGKVTLAAVLAPAIELAEEGVPISAISAQMWADGEPALRHGSPNNCGEMLTPRGTSPREGERMRFPGLARTYRLLARSGRRGFYEGEVARGIVAAVQERGGVMTMEDLKSHGEKGSEEVQPISIEIPWGADDAPGGGKRRVWECAPNGQGLVALQALGILEALQERGVIPVLGSEGGYAHNSVEYLHAIITALRIAFSDAFQHIGDPTSPTHTPIPLAHLLSKPHLYTRSHLFTPTTPPPPSRLPPSHPPSRSDTVYFCTADAHGGGCSFVNSIFSLFGSGIIPTGFGFPLQNRGTGFVLAPETHANALAGGGTRPYHTIMPGVVTGAGGLLDMLFGVMGGYMQPQGHVQVLLGILAFGMSTQEALDAPRVCVDYEVVGGKGGVGGGKDAEGGGGGGGGGDEGEVEEEEKVLLHVELGMDEAVVKGLREMGYLVVVGGGGEGEGRHVFGRGQVIRNSVVGVGEEVGERVGKGRLWSGGSDMRGDGGCVGY